MSQKQKDKSDGSIFLDPPSNVSHYSAATIDDLLERDKQREADGFSRKIKLGRIVRPAPSGGKDKIIVVPTTTEEKLMHDKIRQADEGQSSSGSGNGDEGEIIGEVPIDKDGEAGEGSAGQGDGGEHGIESSAYELGKTLAEKFELPNLKDKGRKRALTRYTYDLTDRHKGAGQLLDKKATLKKILETNIGLGAIKGENVVDPLDLLIAPSDRVFRVLSREKQYESQALVFFLRDYSGSMQGRPTDVVVNQHVLIYSWLLYQYERRVETRFILHDTEAKEVFDFYTYYNSAVAGGTKIISAYRLVNKIIEEEGLARDYNIYVLHGSDGEDWDNDGVETLPEIKKTLYFCNRLGITIVKESARESVFEKYIWKSKLLEESSELIRMDVLSGKADEKTVINSIKKLLS